MSVAERLAEGSVEERDIISLHRFFTVHEKHHLGERQHARDSSCSSLCRSWELRGAERGRAWADRIYRGLVREGKVREDPYDDLMRAEPDEVYAMFSSGAYGWEFGLDTMDKAARFVEDYHRATGGILDLQKAFGESGKAVATAMLRRTSKPDPMILGRQLQDSYPNAVRDTDVLAEAMGERLVFETMRSAGMPTIRMARGISWPEWVAYCATAVEAGVENGPLSGKWDVLHNPRPDPLHEYDGAARTFLTFFHQDGPGFVDDSGTEHEGIHEELFTWLSTPTRDREYVIDLTERLMHWCETTGRTASLSRVYVDAWRRRDWSTIAESVPLDSPHRAALMELGPNDALGEPPIAPGAGQPYRPDDPNIGPRWDVGDVIQNGNRTYYVLAQDGRKIILVPLYVDGMSHTPGAANPEDYSGYRRVLYGFNLVDHPDSPMVAHLAPHITAEPPYVKMDEVPPEWGNVGDDLQIDHNVAYLLGAAHHVDYDVDASPSGEGPRTVPGAIVGIRRPSQWGNYWSIELVSGTSLSRPVKQSYQPGRTYERIHDDVDDEQSDPRMVATPMAAEYAERTGASLTDQQMPFRLGQRFKLGEDATRTVIGLATKDDKPGYILVSEKGNLTWKSADRAHKEFTHKSDGFVQSVIAHAIPHPDAAERRVVEWRRANYRLSEKARGLAREHAWTLESSPKDARFLVGTPLSWQGKSTSILCWIDHPDTEERVAVVDNGESYVLRAELGEEFQVVYGHSSALEEDRTVFGRRGDSINVMHETFAMPTPIDEMQVQPIDEPSFPWVPKGRHVAVAIIGMVPAGTKISSGGKVSEMATPGLVLTHTLGDTDYDLAIPRTAVRTYGATSKSACEGVQRQTGIAMQPHTHVGDFPSGASITRVYTGQIIAGNPHAKREIGEDTDAVVIVHLDERGRPGAWLDELVSRTGDRWQVEAVMEAVERLTYNMVPADHFVRVTGPQDTRTGKPVPALRVMSPEHEPTKNRAVFVSRPLTTAGGTGKL